MKIRYVLWMSMLAMVLFLSACGSGDANETNNDTNQDERLKVVTSFTIIADLAKEIGGDQVEIHNLVPTGTDPHEYEPLPQDTKRATDADALLYNGLNLEGGADGWFFKMINTVGQKDENVFNMTEGVEPMYIGGTDGHEEEINPHGFIDPMVGIQMAENLRDALIEKRPEEKEYFEKQATAYIERLQEIEQDYAEKIAAIPEKRRILVTSERAFQYMTNRYGLEEAFIWEVDTEENGSKQQITSLVEFVKENEVPVLFVESNVDRRPMQTVSEETGVRIADRPIYSDEIGKPGDEVDTYIKYLTYNIDLIHSELSE